MQDFLNFVQTWFDTFSDIFRKLYYIVMDINAKLEEE